MDGLGFQLPSFTYQSRDCVDSAPVVNGFLNDSQTITNFSGDVDCTTVNFTLNLNLNVEVNDLGSNASIDKSDKSVSAPGIGNSLQNLAPANVPIPSQHPRVD
jgi:hypothetical protein